MKAVARLCVAYGTTLPIQRWLGVIVMLTAALAALSPLLGWRAPYALATIAIAMYLLAVTFLTGHLLRELSAPRTHRFLPHFRARMLTALLLVVLIVSAPSLLFMTLSSSQGAQNAGAFLLLMTTGSVLLTFFPAAVLGFGLLAPPAVLLAAGLYERTGGAPSELFGAHARLLAVAVWAGFWLGFSIWYLRGREIRKAGVTPLGFRLLTDRSGTFSKNDALTTSLTAGYPLRPKHRLLRLALLLAAVAAIVALLATFGSTSSVAYLLALPLGAGISGPVSADRIARRARVLWLRSGTSRRRLFALAERVVWIDTLLPTLTALLGLVLSVALAYDVDPARLARLLALAATTATLGVYIGLLFLHGAAMFVAAVGLLAAPLVTGIWATFLAPSYVLVAVTAIQVGAAITARAVAIYRWQRADWLAFRPIRVASQSQRQRA